MEGELDFDTLTDTLLVSFTVPIEIERLKHKKRLKAIINRNLKQIFFQTQLFSLII
jgi:hypothetical protein